MSELETILLHGAIFAIAALYSSVGHGGASGYLAVLALFSFPREESAASALILNILVSSTALAAYGRSGNLKRELAWPLIAASVPAAYFGGWIRVSSPAYSLLLAAALSFAAWRMWLGARTVFSEPRRRLSIYGLLPLGAGIGFVSGMLGIGGGVFLSPILLLSHLADVRQTAAVSAFFILANSASALFGRWNSGLDMGAVPLASFIAAAFLGGWIGSRLGAEKLSNPALSRTLSLVLWMASLKLLARVAWSF